MAGVAGVVGVVAGGRGQLLLHQLPAADAAAGVLVAAGVAAAPHTSPGHRPAQLYGHLEMLTHC